MPEPYSSFPHLHWHIGLFRGTEAGHHIPWVLYPTHDAELQPELCHAPERRELILTRVPSCDLLPSLKAWPEPSKKKHDSVSCHRTSLLYLDATSCLPWPWHRALNSAWVSFCWFLFFPPTVKYCMLKTASRLSSSSAFPLLHGSWSMFRYFDCAYLLPHPIPNPDLCTMTFLPLLQH